MLPIFKIIKKFRSVLPKGEKGFTLVEIVATIVIVSILAGLTGPILSVMIDAMILKVEREGIREQSNYALERMNREMRRIRSPKDVLTATASEFEFVDSDGRTLRYRVVNNELLRQKNGGTERVLADKVSAFTLTYYYSGDGDVDMPIVTPLSGSGTVTDIQRIQIEMEFTIRNHVLHVQSKIKPHNFIQESNVF